jgi:hypothetical protein
MVVPQCGVCGQGVCVCIHMQDGYHFEASLGYTVSSRPVWAT